VRWQASRPSTPPPLVYPSPEIHAIPTTGWGAVAKLGCAVYVAVNWYVVNGWFSEANSRGCGLEIQFNYPAGSAPPQLHGHKLKC
jgi:hypothetical protein